MRKLEDHERRMATPTWHAIEVPGTKSKATRARDKVAARNDRVEKEAKKAAADAETMFKKLDADNSRTLDRGEVETLFKKIGQKKTTQELTAAMRQMDSDGDGTVDFHEFKKWWDVNHTKAWKPHALPDVHGRRSGASHHSYCASGARLFRHQHGVLDHVQHLQIHAVRANILMCFSEAELE